MSAAGTTVAPGVPALADPEEDFLVRLARDPAVDPAKLKAMWEIKKEVREEQRRDEAERQRLACMRARAVMQGEMPIIDRLDPNEQTHSAYAAMDRLWEQCCPVWTRHGFSVAFNAIDRDGLIEVSCIVDHEEGHREIYTAPAAPPDDKGFKGTSNKTQVQGNQATVTYVQRGLLCRAMGIVTRKLDDDGNSGRSRSAAVHQDTKRGPVDPPPKKPPARQSPPVQLTPWVSGLAERLRATQDDLDWARAVQQACTMIATIADLDSLADYLEPSLANEAMPPTMKVDLKVALGDARQRLLVAQRQQACTLVDAAGECDGEVFASLVAWAAAFMALWEAGSAGDRENLLHHNADTLATARTFPAAAKVLASAHPPPPDSAESDGPALFPETGDPDELWAIEKLAALDKLPEGPDWKPRFNGLVAAMRPEMKRLQTANNPVYLRVKAAFEARLKTPAAA